VCYIYSFFIFFFLHNDFVCVFNYSLNPPSKNDKKLYVPLTSNKNLGLKQNPHSKIKKRVCIFLFYFLFLIKEFCVFVNRHAPVKKNIFKKINRYFEIRAFSSYAKSMLFYFFLKNEKNLLCGMFIGVKVRTKLEVFLFLFLFLFILEMIGKWREKNRFEKGEKIDCENGEKNIFKKNKLEKKLREKKIEKIKKNPKIKKNVGKLKIKKNCNLKKMEKKREKEEK
ncbi:hypothetical protein RFI_01977, partial [Reticulomyxa filosa]